eukprot:5659124-Amphidinium_carterae.1
MGEGVILAFGVGSGGMSLAYGTDNQLQVICYKLSGVLADSHTQVTRQAHTARRERGSATA